MTDMIERVARAIFDVWAKDAGLPEDDRNWDEVAKVGHSIVPLAFKEARAAIEAMREPSDEFLDPVVEAICEHEPAWDNAGQARKAWNAGITAALKPEVQL